MSRRYEVAYTRVQGQREFQDFISKSLARKFAEELVKSGCVDVFLDTYDEDNDLIAYEKIKRRL